MAGVAVMDFDMAEFLCALDIIVILPGTLVITY